jgi:crotonobetainyl-CoA:carnitine CoA-transferase CaiB-like acyl-CoA transferase
MRQALEGVRVLDLTRVLVGPYCTMMLGDLGADVIKVEEPGVGDETRTWGPPFVEGESAYYLSVNRNKRSLTVNLRHAEGKRIVRDLAARADVFVENFRPGVVKRLGLDYEALRAINPRLVYASLSAFGQTGPHSQRPGYDLVVLAMSGMMSITGEPDGNPVKFGVAISDLTAGMFAAFSIASALFARQTLGTGQYLDIGLLDGQIALLTSVAGAYFATGEVARRWGSAHPQIAPYQAFPTADGTYIIVAVTKEKFWEALCDVIARPELKADPRFKDNPARVRHRTALVATLESAFRTRPGQVWLKALDEAGIPSGPVNTVDRALTDPHVLERGLVVETAHPLAGAIRTTGFPVKLAETPWSVRRHPPLLGEHTDAILRDELGYPAERIAALRSAGAV